jgi:hypothetical protein
MGQVISLYLFLILICYYKCTMCTYQQIQTLQKQPMQSQNPQPPTSHSPQCVSVTHTSSSPLLTKYSQGINWLDYHWGRMFDLERESNTAWITGQPFGTQGRLPCLKMRWDLCHAHNLKLYEWSFQSLWLLLQPIRLWPGGQSRHQYIVSRARWLLLSF